MKQTLLVLAAFATLSLHAQEEASEPSVEKSVFSIQTGIFGLWVNHELGLGRKIALRTEIGIEPFTVTDNATDQSDVILSPVLTIEPKWYYNLDRRARKGRNTANNSGNSIGLLMHYNAPLFVIGDSKILEPNHLAVGAKYNIRRVYGKHFNFEAGFAAGALSYVGNDPFYEDGTNFLLDITVRIGYTF